MIIQIIGFIAMILLCISSFIKQKDTMLMYQLIAYLILSVHYLLLGGYTGSILELMLVIASILGSKNIKNKNIFMSIFIIVYFLICIVTFTDWYSIIPAIACVIMTWCLIYGNKMALRLGLIISLIGWGLYSAFIGSYSVFISNLLMILFITISLIGGVNREK